MKKFYNNLKQCKYYNILIVAMLATTVIRLFRNLWAAVTGVALVVQWGFGGAYFVWNLVVPLFVTILSIVFLLMACRKNPKWIFVSVGMWCITVIMSEGWKVEAYQCVVAAVYWYWMVTKGTHLSIMQHVKRVTVILIFTAVAACLLRSGIGWISYGFEDVLSELALLVTTLSYNCLNPEILLIGYIYKHTEKGNALKRVIVVLFVFWLMAFVWMTTIGSAIGMWSEWGSDSLDAGSWDSWTTEDGIYYDGEGNSMGIKTFEFE